MQFPALTAALKKNALTALEQSIEHWKDVVSNPLTTNIGRRDCALCNIFNALALVTPCAGCPVSERTGRRFCEGSPFTVFENTRKELRRACCLRSEQNKENAINILRPLAQAELDFLISLRPNTETTV